MKGIGPLTVGVDEAGRGPLAGPVVAAAVVLAGDAAPAGVTDSKRLAPAQRRRLEEEIRSTCLDWALGWATVAEIERLNILHATLLAMRRAVLSLRILPDEALVDGSHCPDLPCRVRSIVGGDATVQAISAASILAKEARDRYMVEQGRIWPGYGFERHKGYPTREHREALLRLGPTPIHRSGFAPVREALERCGRNP